MPRTRFFLDRGLGSRTVPDALRALGWEIETMDERYGPQRSQTIRDVDWISEIAGAGMVGISKDRNIARNGLEVDAVRSSGCRLLLLPNAAIRATEMADRLLRQGRRIDALVAERPGPWIAVVQQRSVELLDR